MFVLLRRLSIPHFAAHPMRAILTVLGIGLGVAAIIGTRAIGESAARSFERAIEKTAGKAVLQITNGDVGVPEELAEELKAVPEVRIVAPLVQGFVTVEGLKGERLFVTGVDFLADDEIRDYEVQGESGIEDPLLFLAQPDSIALATGFLTRFGLRLGDTIRVTVLGRPHTLTIRGSLDESVGPADVFAGRLGVMDVFAAQRLFGLDRRFSQIDLALRDGTTPRAAIPALARVVAGRGVLEHPRARGKTLENMLAGYRSVTGLGGALAVIVGLYLIVNTLAIAVAQRRREIGTLRALGMSRAALARLIAAEALLFGVVGAAAGLPLGYLLAHAMWSSTTAALGARMLPIEGARLTLSPWSAFFGVALGLLAALVAAVQPAREAASLQPVATLRGPTPNAVGGRRYRASMLAGFGAIGLVATFWLVPEVFGLAPATAGAVAQLGLILGIALAAPGLVRGTVRLLGRASARASSPLVLLANRNLAAQLPRVAMTSSGLVMSVTGAVAIATMIASIYRDGRRMNDALFSGMDLAVGSASGLYASDWSPLPEALVRDLAALPGVRSVFAEQWVKVLYRRRLTKIIAVDGEPYRDGRRRVIPVAGDQATATAALADGDGVVVSEVFANRHRVHVGDRIALATPTGRSRFPVRAVVVNPDELGVILMNRALYRRVWRDERVTFIGVSVAQPGGVEDVMRDIRRRWGEQYALFIMTVAELYRQNEDLTANALSAGYPLAIIFMAIAMLGLVSALTASVFDWVRQIGILRALGAEKRDVVRVIAIEATIIGLVGGVLGVATGAAVGYVLIADLFPSLFGFACLYRFPGPAAACFFGAALVSAWLAGHFPGRLASRLRLTDALRYE